MYLYRYTSPFVQAQLWGISPSRGQTCTGVNPVVRLKKMQTGLRGLSAVYHRLALAHLVYAYYRLPVARLVQRMLADMAKIIIMSLPALKVVGCIQLFCMSIVPADCLKGHWPGYDMVFGFACNEQLAIIM